MQPPLKLQHQCQGTVHSKWMSADGLMLGQEIEWMTLTGTACLGRLPGPLHMITPLDLRKVSNLEKNGCISHVHINRTNRAFKLQLVLLYHIYFSGFLMALARNNVQRPGSRAWFASLEMKQTTMPRCMSFW